MKKGTVIAGVFILIFSVVVSIYLYKSIKTPVNGTDIPVRISEELDNVKENDHNVKNDGEGVLRGFIAPDFELSTVEDSKLTLSQFRGKTVFLNFWAVWSSDCKNEFPIILEQTEKYAKQKDVVILSVNVGASKEEVIEFINNYDTKIDVILDAEQALASKYNIGSFPTTFVIDPDGVIYDIVIGKISETIIDEYVHSIKNSK